MDGSSSAARVSDGQPPLRVPWRRSPDGGAPPPRGIITGQRRRGRRGTARPNSPRAIDAPPSSFLQASAARSRLRTSPPGAMKRSSPDSRTRTRRDPIRTARRARQRQSIIWTSGLCRSGSLRTCCVRWRRVPEQDSRVVKMGGAESRSAPGRAECSSAWSRESCCPEVRLIFLLGDNGEAAASEGAEM